jgi:hypothetical protein
MEGEGSGMGLAQTLKLMREVDEQGGTKARRFGGYFIAIRRYAERACATFKRMRLSIGEARADWR